MENHFKLAMTLWLWNHDIGEIRTSEVIQHTHIHAYLYMDTSFISWISDFLFYSFPINVIIFFCFVFVFASLLLHPCVDTVFICEMIAYTSYSTITFVFRSPLFFFTPIQIRVLFCALLLFHSSWFCHHPNETTGKKVEEKKTMTTLEWRENKIKRQKKTRTPTDKLFALAAFLSDSCSDKMSQYDKQNGNFIIQLTFLEHVKFTYGKPTDAHDHI